METGPRLRRFRRLAIAPTLAVLLACFSTYSCRQAVAAEVEVERSDHLRKPNFLLIVADDMGYSDTGAYGGEIDTPNLDLLAKRGVRFSDFYVSPTCSPTRAMLLTGNDSHVAGLGSMAEALRPEQRGKPGYEGHLNRSVATIAERLQEKGYYTAMAGKWHLGGKPDQLPAARGFNQSFALVNGAANYYGLDQGGAWAGTLFAATYFDSAQKSVLPEGAYTTDYFTARLIGFLDENELGGEKPFFAYLAFNAPHTPLQAPPDVIQKYAGRYDMGPEILRQRRFERQVALDLLPDGTTLPPMMDAPAWPDLSAPERAASARRMEVYAAAIDRMDQNIGRVIEALRKSGQLENTVVFFLSDNGAEGAAEEPWLRFLKHLGLPGGIAQSLRSVNRDISRVGSAESYAAYGPAWAQAGSTPFRLTKGFTTEGGLRAPLIISGPGIDGGRILPSIAHVTDIVPTILDLAGLNADPSVTGKPVRRPQGLSLKTRLRGETGSAQLDSRVVCWEFMGRRAVRSGDWKAVYMKAPAGTREAGPGLARWSLYHLQDDPGETTDLSAERPEILEDLVSRWEKYAADNGVVLIPPMD